MDSGFSATVRPFLEKYCVTCHGKEKTEGDLNLNGYSSLAAAIRDSDRWNAIVEKLEAGKMPPKKANRHPSDDSRRQIAHWFHTALDYQTKQNAGDPGVVPVRRLSNAEYDYTIRDLTGVDIRPAKEFPMDPANTAGFDNSGESLVMSPNLLNKYLHAAHVVASYAVLKPHGFEFAPFPMLADTDRDKYCVQRIVNLYHAQDIDYADYFEAAWAYKHRAEFSKADAPIADIAAERHLSPKYLNTIWNVLENQLEEVGPMVKLQTMWFALPGPRDAEPQQVRAGCEEMRQYVVDLRKKVEPRFLNITAGLVNTAAEPLLIWKNVQYATHRMSFDPAQLQVEGEDPPEPPDPEPGTENEFGSGKTRLIHNRPGEEDLFVPAGQRAKLEAAFARFCRVFPDRFYTQERGRNYFDTTKDRGRYLSAGFHSLMGYFRDDQPLYELVLSDRQQKQLDAMWDEMDFVASASRRTYIQFCGSGQRGERSIAQTESKSDNQENDVTSESRIKQLERSYLRRAEGGDPRGMEAIKQYFTFMNDRIRWTEKSRRQAEQSHVDSLVEFAARAYRRPLSTGEKQDVRSYYKSCREAGLDHESAIREGIVSILMSPDMCYRLDLAASGKGIQPLSDYELASRLSYFLWSSMPDEELMARAGAGNLHEPSVLVAQTRRMLKDSRVRALAVEFGGSWLDFRRFNEIATVDRDRFPAFTNDLREAMYEEPIRLLIDAFQSNRSILDLIYDEHTFVNAALARHYGMSIAGLTGDQFVRVDHAGRYDRGGLLGMAVFMTKNAPGLRTSPVKRGNWVVKNLLGERIPAPPPNVPQLPQDEAKLDLSLRDMLARHRQDPNCAACHARFDSLGLVFEGFGPIGERRSNDLAGRAIDASATFPGGEEGTGLSGLRRYIRTHRQKDFIDNLCRKLLAFALGRSTIASDELLLGRVEDKLARGEYRLDTLVEFIVTSPQFLNKRGPDRVASR
jgi:mono/diheme cytochrome c family protein